MFINKTVLITGGTGSFGNAMTQYLLTKGVKQIRIFSRDEKKQDDMRHTYNSSLINYYIGDVRDRMKVNEAMKNVDYVFHAAALKQVPSCEFNPMEAVKTNILGAENVMASAIEYHVKKMVILSTDKSVYPINVMGISKAMMEHIMISKSRTQFEGETILCGVRYGNVLGTRGSVIPLFMNQIKNNNDITITDPSMTRFLMTLEDAVNLVLYALEHGGNGDMFIPKIKTVKLGDLAKEIMDIYNADRNIKIIGCRHGEKLYETLITEDEMQRTEDMGNYFRICSDKRNLNYSINTIALQETFKSFDSNNASYFSKTELRKILLQIPELEADYKLYN